MTYGMLIVALSLVVSELEGTSKERGVFHRRQLEH